MYIIFACVLLLVYVYCQGRLNDMSEWYFTGTTTLLNRKMVKHAYMAFGGTYSHIHFPLDQRFINFVELVANISRSLFQSICVLSLPYFLYIIFFKNIMRRIFHGSEYAS